MPSKAPFFAESSPHVVEATLPPPRPIKRSERLVLILLAANLIYLPWALGTEHLWCQALGLGFSGAGFLIALFLHRPDSEAAPEGLSWRQVATSPALWLGMMILGYITVQALNPAFEYVNAEGESWIVPTDHVTWLPSGISSPLEQMNAFRHLMVFGSALLILWTIVLFVERLKSLRFLLWILVLNGLVLGLLALAQVWSEADQILWTFPSSYPEFYGPFMYNNHAASYLNLALAASLGLFFHFRERSWKENRKGLDEGFIFFCTSIAIFIAVLFSNSPIGVGGAVFLMLLALAYTFIHGRQWNRLREATILSAACLGTLVLIVAGFTVLVGPERILERFEEHQSAEGEMRADLRRQAQGTTIEMIREKPWFGWGAGSYRYVFPAFHQDESEAFRSEDWQASRPTRLHWEYAHNDWLQYPAEYGVVGSGLILLALMFWFSALNDLRAVRQSLPLWLAVVFFLTLAHGLLDFILQNPAIIVTAAAAVAISLRLSQIDHVQRLRRLENLAEAAKEAAEAAAEEDISRF